MVRLGIVGVAGYGWSLVQTINRVASDVGCRLVGAADAMFVRLPERAEELAGAGVELFDDALAMFEALRGRCEAVYIATGIPSHAALTIAVAEAGYHVHLEKPPAATVQDVDRMLDALERAGRFCLVGFQALHGTDVGFIKERVDEGGDKERAVVDGLDDLLVRAARSRCLFSDLRGAPSWAGATGAFDLSDYAAFPARFSVD